MINTISYLTRNQDDEVVQILHREDDFLHLFNAQLSSLHNALASAFDSSSEKGEDNVLLNSSFCHMLQIALPRLWSSRNAKVASEGIHDKPVIEDDNLTRGNHEPVETMGSTSSNKKSVRRIFLRLLPMITLLLAGIALALAHHFFFSYLDGQIIDDEGSELPPLLRDQTTPNIIGTSIAHGARIVLSMAVSATYAQLFWETLRSRDHTIRQIDALVECGQSPLHLSVFRAVAAAPRLVLLSIIASSMSLVVFLSPGALTVSSDFQLLEPCVVPTVPDLTNTTDYDFDALISAIYKVSTSGSYVPPLRTNACYSGASSCTYNISFVGPAFECIDISQHTNFSSTLSTYFDLKTGQETYDPSIIWNAVSSPSVSDLLPSRLVSTLDMVDNVTQANNCTAHPATYDVSVTSNGASVTVQVWNIALASARFNFSDSKFLDQYAFLALDILVGVISAGPGGILQELTPIDPAMSGSKMFVITPTGNHTWRDNMTHTLTSYMQNLSISLLSGAVFYNNSNNMVSAELLYVNSTCSSAWNAYVYEPIRLLATYGFALVITSSVLVPGCWLVVRDGVEDKVMPSRIIESTLNPGLFCKTITGSTHVRLCGSTPGMFIPTQDDLLLSQVNSCLMERKKCAQSIPLSESKQHRLTDRLLLRAYHKQTILLICAASCCMTIHHLYNSFLDKKSLNPSIGRRDWLTNQSMVNHIGITLAYVGQSSLIGAVAISSVQLLWRALRCQGHRISQIDALTKQQINVFSPALFRCGSASFGVIITSLVSTSLSLLSIFAPNSIKVSFNAHQSITCTIKSPINLTSLSTSNQTDFSTQTNAVFLSGTYFPPTNPCNVSFGSQCSYGTEFIGPGFDCEDVTASSNFSAFQEDDAWLKSEEASDSIPDLSPAQNLSSWTSSIYGDDHNSTMRLSVQTWDALSLLYRATTCTGVLRKYSLLITHASTSSTIEVTDSSTLAPILVQPGTNLSVTNATFSTDTTSLLAVIITLDTATFQNVVPFMELYTYFAMWILVGQYGNGGAICNSGSLISFPNLVGSPSPVNAEGSPDNVAWNSDMPEALQEYAENVTLSILSGEIFTSGNPEGPEILEDLTTTCNYTYTAYEYTASTLFISYGIATAVTILCVIAGFVAIKRNGVEESMAFSRFLRAILNERMYNVRERLDMDSVIKADDNEEGAFAPYLKTTI